MRNKFYLLFFFLLFNSLLLSAQSINFKGPKEEGFFPIGWSKDGKIFAYGTYNKTISVSNAAQLIVVIQNVVTDKIVWQISYLWDEGNMGQGSTSSIPKSPEAAWKEHSIEIAYKLKEEKINVLSGSIKPLPFIKVEESISINIVNHEEGTYDITAISSTRGSKAISSGDTGYDFRELGYVGNPDNSIIVVIFEYRTGWPFSAYKAAGCNTKYGFEIDPK